MCRPVRKYALGQDFDSFWTLLISPLTHTRIGARTSYAYSLLSILSYREDEKQILTLRWICLFPTLFIAASTIKIMSLKPQGIKLYVSTIILWKLINTQSQSIGKSRLTDGPSWDDTNSATAPGKTIVTSCFHYLIDNQWWRHTLWVRDCGGICVIRKKRPCMLDCCDFNQGKHHVKRHKSAVFRLLFKAYILENLVRHQFKCDIHLAWRKIKLEVSMSLNSGLILSGRCFSSSI